MASNNKRAWNNMVTITVPDGLNGWQYSGTVTINGRPYTFPVGVETQVPEPVAEYIQRLIEEEEANKPVNPNKPSSGLPSGADPHQQLVTDAEGNPKWEDRGFYAEQTVKTLYNDVPDRKSGSYGSFVYDLGGDYEVPLNRDASYTVELNGVVHEMVLNAEHSVNGIVSFGLKNPTEYEFMLTDESKAEAHPNAVTYLTTMGVSVDEGPVVVVETSETIKKLDPKYLPEPIVFTYFDDDATCICNMSFNDAFKALTSYQDVFLRMDVASSNDIVMHKYIRMTANYYMDRGSVENGDYEIGMLEFRGKTDEDAKVKITYNADGTIEIIIN